MSPGTTTLKTAIATYAHTKGLKDGSISVPGVTFEHVELSPITRAFRSMCRTLDFDVSEMAITTYLTAKAFDKRFTALPVFVMRQFHHAPVVYNVKSGVQSPRDLEGKKVGVRAYTVTTGVWTRGILATEYGVDLDKITWVVVDEEHVQEYRKPSSVEERPGANLAELLAKGELAAAIGAGKVDSSDVKPLFPDAAAAEAAWYRKTGIYPINHTVVVKDTLLQADPTLAPRLVAGFEAAKAQFLTQISAGAELSTDAQAVAKRRSVVGDDPLPNGVARNRKALEAIAQFARDQKILPRTVAPEAMFAANAQEPA
jgi:4,5-dihydroxyphthalate decarboxylase